MLDLQNRFPDIREKIRDRAKRGDVVVLVRDLYIEWEKDERTGQEKQRIHPQIVRWGTLVALDAFRMTKANKIGGRLNEAIAALENAVASIEQPNSAMSKSARALEYGERADRDLDALESVVDAFCRPENLKLLWLLAREPLEQRAVARAVLELTSGRAATRDEAAVAIDAWAQEIVLAHAGREFEIVD